MAVPGHPTVRAGAPDGYYLWTYGQCTYQAVIRRRQDHRLDYWDLRHSGDARSWLLSAQRRGYPTGMTPVAGATVVFQPGVQGAAGGGHVAHVEDVYPDGWFMVSEMDFYANGGSWGRVDYRFAHSGPGVGFIY
jgi:surface antigen